MNVGRLVKALNEEEQQNGWSEGQAHRYLAVLFPTSTERERDAAFTHWKESNDNG